MLKSQLDAADLITKNMCSSTAAQWEIFAGYKTEVNYVKGNAKHNMTASISTPHTSASKESRITQSSSANEIIVYLK